MKSLHVALFVVIAVCLLACGTRVSLGELVPDERSNDDGTNPAPSPSPSPGANVDAGPALDANDPIDAGPGPNDDAGDIDGGKAPYMPCAAKACGADCSVCDPLDPFCVETAVLKACDKTGACVAAPASCN